MTELLYDSDSPGSIPVGVQAAGYVDGTAGFNWRVGQGWSRFPDALRIALSALHDADILDVERGAATPADCPAWVKRQNARGVIPWVYVNRSNRSAVEQGLHNAGCTPANLRMWVATLDNTKGVTPSPYGFAVAAVQYANSVLTGHHYDLSIVYIPFRQGGKRKMALFHVPATDANVAERNKIYSIGAEGKRWIQLAEFAALQRLGEGTYTDVSAADLSGIPDVVNRKQLVDALWSPTPGPGPTPLVNIINNVTNAKLQQLQEAVNALQVAQGGLTAEQANQLSTAVSGIARLISELHTP